MGRYGLRQDEVDGKKEFVTLISTLLDQADDDNDDDDDCSLSPPSTHALNYLLKKELQIVIWCKARPI